MAPDRDKIIDMADEMGLAGDYFLRFAVVYDQSNSGQKRQVNMLWRRANTLICDLCRAEDRFFLPQADEDEVERLR